MDAVVDAADAAAVASPSSFCSASRYYAKHLLIIRWSGSALFIITETIANQDWQCGAYAEAYSRPNGSNSFKHFTWKWPKVGWEIPVTTSENSLKNMAIIWLWAATLCVFGICAIIVPLWNLTCKTLNIRQQHSAKERSIRHVQFPLLHHNNNNNTNNVSSCSCSCSSAVCVERCEWFNSERGTAQTTKHIFHTVESSEWRQPIMDI